MTSDVPGAPPEAVQLTFRDGRASEIVFEGIADTPRLMVERGIQPGACLVVTDENVARLHLTPLVEALSAGGWRPRTRVIKAGEASKSLRTVSEVYDWALEPAEDGASLTRDTPVLALGGGVVGDLAGFAAATLLRGLPLVQVPTTLLAQVDSAIGGKTGIDHARGKNLIGAFHQPVLTVADPRLLGSLPQREWFSGLAEVIKVALVSDEHLYGWLERNWKGLVERDAELTAEMVRRAAVAKAHIVEADEREAGRRAVLNFGHTFAHAIERATDYLVYTHGEAVALGMRAAIHLSAELTEHLDRDRAEHLPALLPLPADLDTPLSELLDAMMVDKKRTRGHNRLVLLETIGDARLAADVPDDAIVRAWEYVRGLVP